MFDWSTLLSVRKFSHRSVFNLPQKYTWNKVSFVELVEQHHTVMQWPHVCRPCGSDRMTCLMTHNMASGDATDLSSDHLVTNKRSSANKEMMISQATVHPHQFNTSAASELKKIKLKKQWTICERNKKDVLILLKALLAKTRNYCGAFILAISSLLLSALTMSCRGIITYVCESASVSSGKQGCISEIKRGCGTAVRFKRFSLILYNLQQSDAWWIPNRQTSFLVFFFCHTDALSVLNPFCFIKNNLWGWGWIAAACW